MEHCASIIKATVELDRLIQAVGFERDQTSASQRSYFDTALEKLFLAKAEITQKG
jgi:hypothetical protein